MLDTAVGILAARLVFGVEHLTLAALGLHLEKWPGQQALQPLQGWRQGACRYLADEIGMAGARRGIDQPATTAHIRH